MTRLSIELSRMMAFIKAVAAAIAFSVDGVLGIDAEDGVPGMTGGVWARLSEGALRVIVARTIKGYNVGLLMVQK